ncbi:MAG: cation transporter [Clostridia bacterium]|nr:cation transporter [Clostridia bacterium]
MVKTTVAVEGMMCPMCEAHVNDAVRNGFKVKSVSSSHKDNRTEIVSEEALDEAALKAAIEKTGYKVGNIETEPYEKKGLFSRK